MSFSMTVEHRKVSDQTEGGRSRDRGAETTRRLFVLLSRRQIQRSSKLMWIAGVNESGKNEHKWRARVHDVWTNETRRWEW